MHRNRKRTVIEIIIVVACLALSTVSLPTFFGRVGIYHYESKKAQCENHLSQIAKAMAMYLLKCGDNSFYAVPAESFRGDCWLASLYWSGIIKDPQVFLCPGSGDKGKIPGRPPKDLSLASAVPADAVSYAGLCYGLKGKYAHRSTPTFTESALSSACILACDDNEGTLNHSVGICVVYFDCHIEFHPGPRSETYDLIGAAGSPYWYLDSGEE